MHVPSSWFSAQTANLFTLTHVICPSWAMHLRWDLFARSAGALSHHCLSFSFSSLSCVPFRLIAENNAGRDASSWKVIWRQWMTWESLLLFAVMAKTRSSWWWKKSPPSCCVYFSLHFIRFDSLYCFEPLRMLQVHSNKNDFYNNTQQQDIL